MVILNVEQWKTIISKEDRTSGKLCRPYTPCKPLALVSGPSSYSTQ